METVTTIILGALALSALYYVFFDVEGRFRWRHLQRPVGSSSERPSTPSAKVTTTIKPKPKREEQPPPPAGDFDDADNARPVRAKRAEALPRAGDFDDADDVDESSRGAPIH